MNEQAELIIPTDDTTMPGGSFNPHSYRFYESQGLSAGTSAVEPLTFTGHSHYIGEILSSEILPDIFSKNERGLPGDFIIITCYHATAWKPPETDTEELPDVFSPPHRRRILFSTSVKIQSGKMRRWKPHIVIESDELAEDENE